MSLSPTPPPKSRGAWIIGAVVAVVVAVAAVALIATRSSDDDSTSAATTAVASGGTSSAGGTGSTAKVSTAPTSAGPSLSGGAPVAVADVTIKGAKLDSVPDSGADPAQGRAFPELSGAAVADGAALSITNDGRPKIVMFIAHWCPHCQREVPVITKWIAEHGAPADVDLYAVSTAVAPERGNYPPATWLKKENWPVPTLADDADGSAFKAAGLTSFPSFVVVNAAGNVVTRASGELSVAQFESLLARAGA